MKRELIELDIGNILVKSHLRQNLGDLMTLEKSIRQIGLLSPVIIDCNNVLISGKRRLEACRNLGLTRIPAFKLDINALSMTGLDIQADENLCRLPLSSDELNNLIQKKKDAIGSKSILGFFRGIIDKIKKIIKK